MGMAQLRFPFKGFDIALKKLRIPHRQPLMIRVMYHYQKRRVVLRSSEWTLVVAVGSVGLSVALQWTRQ